MIFSTGSTFGEAKAGDQLFVTQRRVSSGWLRELVILPLVSIGNLLGAWWHKRRSVLNGRSWHYMCVTCSCTVKWFSFNESWWSMVKSPCSRMWSFKLHKFAYFWLILGDLIGTRQTQSQCLYIAVPAQSKPWFLFHHFATLALYCDHPAVNFAQPLCTTPSWRVHYLVYKDTGNTGTRQRIGSRMIRV